MVIVLVQFPRGPRSRADAIAQAQRSAPTYRDLAGKGLIRKHYLNGPTGGGGVYLWRTRADAEAWYTDEWKTSMTQRFGVEPIVTWYDNPVIVDNILGTTEVTE